MSRATRVSLFDQENPNEALEFDAIMREKHSGSTEVTDHPIEGGSDIADHIKTKPDRLSLEVVVSDHPIIFARSQNATGAVAGGDANNRSKDAYEFVVRKRKAGRKMKIALRIREYSDMLILSEDLPVDASKGNIAAMTIELRSIVIAKTDAVDAPKPRNPARKPKATSGKKHKPPAPKKVEKKVVENESTLFSVLESAAAATGG